MSPTQPAELSTISAHSLGTSAQQLRAGSGSTNLQAARDIIIHTRDASEPNNALSASVAADPSLSTEAKTLLLVALIKGGEVVRMIERGVGETISVGQSPTRVGFTESDDTGVSSLDAFDSLLQRGYLRPATVSTSPFFNLTGTGRAVARAMQEQIDALSKEAKTLLLAGAVAWRAGDDPHFKVGPPGVRGVSAGSGGQFGRQDAVTGPRYEEALEDLERLQLAKARTQSAHCLTTAGADLAAVIETARRVLGDTAL